MQEEVENRTLTLVVSGTKFTGRLLKAAISKYMAHCKEKKLQKQRSRDAPVTYCLLLPFFCRTSYGFIVIRPCALCKLSQTYPTMCAKKLGYI